MEVNARLANYILNKQNTSWSNGLLYINAEMSRAFELSITK